MADGGEARALADRPSGVTFRMSSSKDRLRLLVDDHFDLVWRSLRRFGVPEADTDDAAQEVFVVLSRRLNDVEAGAERAFLLGTAVRVASTRRRAAHRRPELLMDCPADAVDPAPDPEQLTKQLRARRLLDALLDELDDDVRTVFVLFELEELATTEIAAVLTLPVGTVASRLRRAREQFHAASARFRARSARIEGNVP